MPCPRERLTWSFNLAVVNDHLDLFLEGDCSWALVEVEKESHYKNLIKTSMLVNVPVKLSPHRTLNTIKFTPVEDIVDNLKEQGVSEAQKIIITKDGNKITTATIILTFHGSTVPSEINVGFMKVKVSPFIPNPLRCFGCQQFGHHKNNCQNASKCPNWMTMEILLVIIP